MVAKAKTILEKTDHKVLMLLTKKASSSIRQGHFFHCGRFTGRSDSRASLLTDPVGHMFVQEMFAVG